MDDPRAVLGLGPDASPAEASRARRRLARSLHPDLHDPQARADAESRMAVVNRAYDVVVAEMAVAAVDVEQAPGRPDGPTPVEEAAFAVDALPVDAFDAVLLAAVDLGDVIRAEPPYLLAVLLDDPGPCQCVLELAPDAGGTTVWIDIGPRHFGTVPDVQAVRDALVAGVARQLADR